MDFNTIQMEIDYFIKMFNFKKSRNRGIWANHKIVFELEKDNFYKLKLNEKDQS